MNRMVSAKFSPTARAKAKTENGFLCAVLVADSAGRAKFQWAGSFTPKEADQFYRLHNRILAARQLAEADRFARVRGRVMGVGQTTKKRRTK